MGEISVKPVSGGLSALWFHDLGDNAKKMHKKSQNNRG